MTVKELIEKLQEFNGETRVMTFDSQDKFVDPLLTGPELIPAGKLKHMIKEDIVLI